MGLELRANAVGFAGAVAHNGISPMANKQTVMEIDLWSRCGLSPRMRLTRLLRYDVAPTENLGATILSVEDRILDNVQGAIITTVFPFFSDSRRKPPNDRMKVENRLNEDLDEIYQSITSRHMGQFVMNNVGP